MFQTQLTSKMYLCDNPLSQSKQVDRIHKAFAGFGDVFQYNQDLIFLQGIFTSTGQNYNRDVTLPSELWKSFATAIYKPVNIEHRIQENNSLVSAIEAKASYPIAVGDNTIIGMIYDAMFVDEETGKMVLASERDKVNAEDFKFAEAEMGDMWDNPHKYNVIVAAALWKFLFPKTIAKLVERVQNSEMALSMEAYFTDYDYLVDGKVTARNTQPEMESFYQTAAKVGRHRVGRVMRNITFGAVGLTGNPANPFGFDYVQVSKDAEVKTHFAHASLIPVEREDKTTKEDTRPEQTPDSEPVNTAKGEQSDMELKDLIDKVTELTQANASITKSFEQAQAKITELEAKIQKTETDLVKATADLEKATAALTEKTSALDATAASKSELEQSVAAKDEEIKSLSEAKAALEEQVKPLDDYKTRMEAAETEVAKAKIEKTVAERTEKLKTDEIFVESRDTAEALASMTDEQFEKAVAERKELVETLKKAEASEDNGDGGNGPSILNDPLVKKAMAAVSAGAKKTEVPQAKNLDALYSQI